ncbi:MAG: hypothetical protein ABIY55_18020, partial [Kofleriaceae bacterium]
MNTAVWWCGLAGLVAGCGSVQATPPTDGAVDAAVVMIDAAGLDGPTATPVPVTPVAPTVEHPMYQGSQTLFKTQLGTTCTGRVAASMSRAGFCYLAASDDVKCAGSIGDVSYGMNLGPTGQTNASQLMIMFSDNGICLTKTDHTVVCMGDNPNAFGTTGSPASFTRWTAHADVAAIGSGTWDQICGITTGGQVFCGGMGYAVPPINVGTPLQSSFWVSPAGLAQLSDTVVLRPSESRTECQVKAAGLTCGANSYGPTNGSVVMGTIVASGGGEAACWLTSAGSVDCSYGARFAAGKVVFLAAS